MKSEWKECTIESCTSIVGDGLHGTPKYSTTGDFAFINGNNLSNGKIIIKPETKKVDKSQFEKYKKPLCDRTILVSINGTLGNVALYNDEKVVLGKSACFFNVIDEVDKQFIKYILLSPDFQSYLENNATGTTIKNISLKQIKEYTFLLPNIETQRKISSILLSIDDKISLNKAINENLQEQAQAIYSDIFISNANPAWKTGYLSDLIIVRYGKDHKKLADGAYPVYGSGGIMRYVERPLYNKESVLIPRKGSLNNVMYVNEPFWSVDTMFFTEMKQPNIAKFIFHFVKSKDLASLNSGSAVPSMTTDILNSMELLIPDANAFAKFESIVAPIYLTIQQNIQESNKLAKLRDLLLPKLMSGEIDVSNLDL